MHPYCLWPTTIGRRILQVADLQFASISSTTITDANKKVLAIAQTSHCICDDLVASLTMSCRPATSVPHLLLL